MGEIAVKDRRLIEHVLLGIVMPRATIIGAELARLHLRLPRAGRVTPALAGAEVPEHRGEDI